MPGSASKGLQLGGVGGGLVAEIADQPGLAGGERGWSCFVGVRTVGPGRAGLWQAVGGEAGHQALEAPGGAGETGPERHDQQGEAGIAEEAARDQRGEAGDDQADPTGDVGGGGLDRGGDGCEGH